MYDIIGDVHGHAVALEQLLDQLGYCEQRGAWRHPERKAIFVGDWIDRGPDIPRVLDVVRRMVAEDAALAVLGNHEWNALAFHTPDSEAPGEFLRRHSQKNRQQIRETRQQMSPEALRSALDWFRTLPLWLDLGELRVVHACWDPAALARLAPHWSPGQLLTDDLLIQGARPAGKLFSTVETLLKGPEIPLPPGVSYTDKDGHQRTRSRIRWYRDPAGLTYEDYAWGTGLTCTQPLRYDVLRRAQPYPATAPPVFIGHYSLMADRPSIMAGNVACLDYNVARGGFLCAYRWNGESKLSNDRFVWTHH